MNMKKRMEESRKDIGRNSEIRLALDRFVKQVNTPEKADETIGYLTYRSSTKYNMASEFLRVIGEELGLSYMHRSEEVTRPLADLCLLLGSPDNCRIVNCAIVSAFLLNEISLNERDSGNAEWCWIMDAYWAISHLIDGIINAKATEDAEKAKEAK